MKKLFFISALMLAVLAHSDVLPDPKLTPGAVDVTMTKEKLCDKNFHTGTIRNVSESEKNQVYKEYNVVNHQGYCSGAEGCEIDHLISLEIGGLNDIKNLWAQSYSGPTNAHDKDKLENKLHAMVCSGQITLEESQKEISSNWIEAFKKYVK